MHHMVAGFIYVNLESRNCFLEAQVPSPTCIIAWAADNDLYVGSVQQEFIFVEAVHPSTINGTLRSCQ